MCIMGDVLPAMLALDTPDDVYNYSIKLIKDLGSILGQSCDIPPKSYDFCCYWQVGKLTVYSQISLLY